MAQICRGRCTDLENVLFSVLNLLIFTVGVSDVGLSLSQLSLDEGDLSLGCVDLLVPTCD